MVEESTSQKIFKMAVQIERKGYEFYKFMESNVQNSKLKKIYGWLKEQEKHHIEDFEKMFSSPNKLDTLPDFDLDESFLYFKAIFDTKIFSDPVSENRWAQELKDEIGAIQIAISFEKDAILFLEELKSMLNEQEQKIIQKLIKEEKEHVVKLLQTKKELASG